jgi:hypothetical protein
MSFFLPCPAFRARAAKVLPSSGAVNHNTPSRQNALLGLLAEDRVAGRDRRHASATGTNYSV